MSSSLPRRRDRHTPPDWSKVPDGTRSPMRGWGPTRATWYSFCSKLHGLDSERRAVCPACNAGSWHNVWAHRIDSRIHARHYRLWFWWHNRPNSRSRQTIELHFPRLRGRGR